LRRRAHHNDSNRRGAFEMTPDPHPTLTEKADQLKAAAHKARIVGDLVFARELEQRAQDLRDSAEAKNAH
jgi:hypothetical protein